MQAFLAAHGGMIPAIILVMTLVNILLSAVSKGLGVLGDKSPPWLATILSGSQKVIDFLTANVEHKP